MASIRKFKKEIAYQTNEIASNCYLAQIFQGKEATESLNEIIYKAVDNYNELRGEINALPKEGKKQYIDSLRKKMNEKADELYSQISDVCQKK